MEFCNDNKIKDKNSGKMQPVSWPSPSIPILVTPLGGIMDLNSLNHLVSWESKQEGSVDGIPIVIVVVM